MFMQLMEELEEPFTGEDLFDHLHDVVYFIKDKLAAYVVVNNTLVMRSGLTHKTDLIGRKASEVLRPPLGDGFEEQDRQVIRSGKPLRSQLELHLYQSGSIGWCMTTKLPLRSKHGGTCGLVGVSQDLQLPDLRTEEYEHIAAAINFAEENLSAPPTVNDLAKIAQMSRYQLDRRMRRVFGLKTAQWLIKLRIDLAQSLLVETKQSIATIAVQAGYGDQSAFTRQFRKATGLTPREFRLARCESPSELAMAAKK